MKPPAESTPKKSSSRSKTRSLTPPKRKNSGTKGGKATVKKKVIDGVTENTPILIPKPVSDTEPSQMNRPYEQVQRPVPTLMN